MKEIINKIVQFVIPAKDKLEHYYLWSLIFFTLIFSFDFIHKHFSNVFISDWWAYGVTVYTAIWKEVYHDWYKKKGKPSLKDFLFGIAMASLYMYSVN